MSATLQLHHDGRSNVLQIRRGTASGVHNVVVDCCKELPRNHNDTDGDNVDFNRRVVSRIAQSTDFVCSYGNCSYHHKSESRYILHARSHFDFEVAPDAVHDTEFKFVRGKYTCTRCPRTTGDWIAFREHVRHHIFDKPYKCSLCMIPVASVRELRIHFQMLHAGKQTDFVFNGSVHELNTLLNAMLPEAAAITEPVNVILKAPTNTTTRISCTSVSDETHPVGLMTKLRELSTADKVAGSRSSSGRNGLGKYEYRQGVYKCVTCSYETREETVFSRHAWKHIHGSQLSRCLHNTKNILSSECAVVNGLISMLKAVDSLKKKSECGTEHTVNHAADAPKSVANHTSAGDSKY